MTEEEKNYRRQELAKKRWGAHVLRARYDGVMLGSEPLYLKEEESFCQMGARYHIGHFLYDIGFGSVQTWATHSMLQYVDFLCPTPLPGYPEIERIIARMNFLKADTHVPYGARPTRPDPFWTWWDSGGSERYWIHWRKVNGIKK